MDRNRSKNNCEMEELREYKADILGHPLYDQLLSAHVSCLRVATSVDQFLRIDAQLQQYQHLLHNYSSKDIFQSVCVPLVRNALAGYNTSILPYGQGVQQMDSLGSISLNMKLHLRSKF
ncbi:hypothetical protein RYX36_035535 [Vicia faba]